MPDSLVRHFHASPEEPRQHLPPAGIRFVSLIGHGGGPPREKTLIAFASRPVSDRGDPGLLPLTRRSGNPAQSGTGGGGPSRGSFSFVVAYSGADRRLPNFHVLLRFSTVAGVVPPTRA